MESVDIYVNVVLFFNKEEKFIFNVKIEKLISDCYCIDLTFYFYFINKFGYK